MVARRAERVVRDALEFQAAVAVIGPRQVGKTTLARAIGVSLCSILPQYRQTIQQMKSLLAYDHKYALLGVLCVSSALSVVSI